MLDFIGPLGLPSDIRKLEGTVVLVGGGLGVAPIYPQLREYKLQGNRTISIVGFRNRDLMFWEDGIPRVQRSDDRHYGRRQLRPQRLRLAGAGRRPGDRGRARSGGHRAAPMMKACCETTRPFGVPTVVSLNSIMVDGTGMCGSCRVTVGGKMKFACVDGADFDGHLVNFDELSLRQKRFEREEKAALDRYRDESAKLASLKAAEWQWRAAAVHLRTAGAGDHPPGPRMPKNIQTIPPERVPMPHQPAEERRHNFKEVALGLDLEGALHEAERCLRCKKPRCVPGCPVGIDIPGFIAAIQERISSVLIRF